MKFIRLAAFFIIGTVCVSRADSPAAPGPDKINGKEIQLAHYAKAFIGTGNITVEVAPYKIGDKDGAILLFHGIESDWDGKAINHSVDPGFGGGQDYATTVKGKRYVTLTMRKNSNDHPMYDLYIPEIQDPIALAPSDGAAQATSPRKILEEYQKQQRKK